MAMGLKEDSLPFCPRRTGWPADFSGSFVGADCAGTGSVFFGLIILDSEVSGRETSACPARAFSFTGTGCAGTGSVFFGLIILDSEVSGRETSACPARAFSFASAAGPVGSLFSAADDRTLRGAEIPCFSFAVFFPRTDCVFGVSPSSPIVLGASDGEIRRFTAGEVSLFSPFASVSFEREDSA
ncbi:MAG: hypothetical protein ACI4MF_11105 [Candidatus Faecivicinus sp.]